MDGANLVVVNKGKKKKKREEKGRTYHIAHQVFSQPRPTQNIIASLKETILRVGQFVLRGGLMNIPHPYV